MKVFVRHDHYEWLPALDDNRVSLDLPTDWQETTENNGDINALNASNDTLPRDDNVLVKDLADLLYLHEASVLYQIKARHVQNMPYTRVGDIVVAVNPCRRIDDLYTEQQQQKYAMQVAYAVPDVHDEKKDDDSVTVSSMSLHSQIDRLDIEPHVYEISALAYRGIRSDKINQTIVVSGESGAGKTETIKIVVHHLATIQKHITTESRRDDLIRYILASSPIFEAFGNAKTLRNDNSSRFGKMTRLCYSQSNSGSGTLLKGCRFDTYLVETNRVNFHIPNERNFHIFYQFLASSPEFIASVLGDANVRQDDFKILANSGSIASDDAVAWDTVASSLNVFGWTQIQLVEMCRALAIVLYMGNLIFVDDSDGLSSVANKDELEKLANLMDMTAQEVENAFTKLTITASNEEVLVPLDAGSAKDLCEALTKRIYLSIFHSIVRSINYMTSTAEPEDDDYYISLLDIYGFEKSEESTFEQLCINYTNEQLQQLYIRDNLFLKQREYREEGVEDAECQLINNRQVLDLFEGPYGIINLLDEQCSVPNGNIDAFVYKLKASNKDNVRLLSMKLHQSSEFGIAHFASNTVYDASQFLERNMDKLPASLMQFALNCGNGIICSEFANLTSAQDVEANSEQTRKLSSNTKTVLSKFKSQLKELINDMRSTKVRYIRCVKPNDSLVTTKFNHNVAMRQLRCSGLVTAIDITREGYTDKLLSAVFFRRFKWLVPKVLRVNLEMEDVPMASMRLAEHLLVSPNTRIHNVCGQKLHACGKSKIYFKSGVLNQLEVMRKVMLSEYATTIQAEMRRYLCYSRYRSIINSVVKVQATWRSVRLRKRYQHVLHSVRIIQRAWMRYLQPSTLHSLRRSIISFQVLARYALSRRKGRAKTSDKSPINKANTKNAQLPNKARKVILVQSIARRYIVQAKQQRRPAAAKTIARKLEQYYFRSKRQQGVEKEVWLTAIRGTLFPSSSITLPPLFNRSKELMKNGLSSHSSSGGVEQSLATSDLVRQQKAKINDQTAELDRFRNKVNYFKNKADTKDIEVAQISNEVKIYKRRLQENENEMSRLRSELERSSKQISSLRNAIDQVTEDAEVHKQVVTCDLEERLQDYEEEVLSLQISNEKHSRDKQRLLEEMAASQRIYFERVKCMRDYAQKNQFSHSEYLSKITKVLSEVEAARRAEVAKIYEDIRSISEQKSRQVVDMEKEARLLRKMVDAAKQKHTGVDDDTSSPISDKLRRFVDELERIVTPKRVLRVVSEASKHPHTDLLFIESQLTFKIRQTVNDLMEKLDFIDDTTTSGESTRSSGSSGTSAHREELQLLQQKLVSAYEEIERLQGQQSSDGSRSTSKNGGNSQKATKRRFFKLK